MHGINYFDKDIYSPRFDKNSYIYYVVIKLDTDWTKVAKYINWLLTKPYSFMLTLVVDTTYVNDNPLVKSTK